MNDCAEARALMGAQVLGVLDDDEARVLFVHLARCEECAAKHARLSPLVPLIDRAGPIDESPNLPGQTQERLLLEAASKAGEAGEPALSIQLYAKLLSRYPQTTFSSQARAAVVEQKKKLTKA